MATATATAIEIEIPSVDKRLYKHVQLGGTTAALNGMDVLLISDPETDKCSAAMDVNIGQFCDAHETQGIAHFLEHMLFIGTTKYPEENDYDGYLSQHGGSSNAYTDLEHTCYFFDIQATEHTVFANGFDRFAQCFIAPLFTKSALEREVQAVDSEHAKNIPQDMWRMYQLSKTKLVEATDPSHPFGGFGSGNAESLPTVIASSSTSTKKENDGDEAEDKDGNGDSNNSNAQDEDNNTHIRSQLIAFFHKYYRKNLSMYKLVVLGKESLEVLEGMVHTYFDELVDIFDKKEHEGNTVTTKHEMMQELYPGPTAWSVPQRIHVVPISQVHSMELQFPMREIQSLYESKPTQYLSHLLGHEGSGSLLSYLKNNKGYVTDLYADDSSKSCTSFSIFTIKMELTTLGLVEQNTKAIIAIVFAYIHLLTTVGPKEWIYNEAKIVSEMQFRFLSKRNPIDYTSQVSNTMQQQYPPHLYLSGPYTTQKWEPTLITECLQYLVPNNVLVLISSPTFDTAATETTAEDSGPTMEEEKWYGTKYVSIEHDTQLYEQWNTIKHTEYPELQLPENNDMIATDFTLLCPPTSSNDDGKNETAADDAVPTDRPRCIHSDNNIQLWYKPDNIFGMPKVNIMMKFTSGMGSFVPVQAICAQLFTEMCSEKCNEFSYLATMAGLHCAISPSTASSGLELHCSGYNHKAHKLVERLLDTVMDLVFPSTPQAPSSTVGGNNPLMELFERVKFKLEQTIQQFLVGQSYQHCIYGGDLVLETNRKSKIEDKMVLLQSVTLDEVLQFGVSFLKYCKLDVLIHGNVSAQHAYDITTMVWNKTHPNKSVVPQEEGGVSATIPTSTKITRVPIEKRVVQLVNNSTINEGSLSSSFLYKFPVFNDANLNSCVAIVLQLGALDYTNNAKLALFNNMVREPAFNQLRTEEQLGYIVHTSVKTSGDHIKSLLLLVQSDGFHPDHVESRIELFLSNFRQRIVDMSNETFQSYVDAVVSSFLEKNKNLGEESSRYWHVILNETYDFSRYAKLADHVKTLNKLDLLRFYDRFVAKTAPDRRKLCVHVVAKQYQDQTIDDNAGGNDNKEIAGETVVDDKEEKTVKEEGITNTSEKDTICMIDDPIDFRRELPLYPMPPKIPVEVVDVGIRK